MSAPTNPNALPPYAVLPELGLDSDEQRSLIKAIWAQLITGSDDLDEFVEHYAGSHASRPPETLAAAHAALRGARLRQQREIGDYRTRTAAAFDELNANGVLARADFTCCNTCANNDIYGEAVDVGGEWIGYVFFHGQDTYELVGSGETYLGFDVFDPEDFDETVVSTLSDAEKATKYIADLHHMLDDVVFPILRRHGIDTEWDRDPGMRVLMTNADWFIPIGVDAN